MSKTVISVEGLSKEYKLGTIGRKTLHEDLNRWLYKLLQKEDPSLKIGEHPEPTKQSQFVWALNNLNFKVDEAEVLSIIGPNGAGKSTLLKILSKVTSPTKGMIKIKGKIASLLEVGTGFHPELTGKDNIFLNGAILGMTKQEVRKKLDQIIDFAGIDKYIDTPVKRYSSGMYVRLAFAVAAHLEPDILIVDEILAVGDAEFQKRCLGKMRDVSEKEGRTVLFVSHNMAAVTALTTKSIVLEKGKIVFTGETSAAVTHYLKSQIYHTGIFEKKPRDSKPNITRVEVITSEDNGIHINGKTLVIEIDVYMPYNVNGMSISLQIFNSREIPVIYTYTFYESTPILTKVGLTRYKCTLQNCKLYQDRYYLKLHLAETKGKTKYETIDKICEFEVKMAGKIIEWGWTDKVCIYTENFVWNEI